MENSTKNTPVLEQAWAHYAELDANSLALTRRHTRLRQWIAILGVLATLLAILTDTFSDQLPELGALILKFFFVITPITGSVLAAFINKFYGSGSWLVMRAGAEEILKEIYIYRTILAHSAERRSWLIDRLATIRRQVYKGLGGELALKPYKGPLPPHYSPEGPDRDAGFNDLDGDQYLKLRLELQLAWHIGRVNRFQRERTSLQVWILAMGGAGALLAAFGGPLATWVAFTAAIASALIGWSELRNLDTTVKNYSKVILELDILRDHWLNLQEEERTEQEFYNVVKSCEDILWSQNVEYIKAMQEALVGLREEEADLVTQVIKKSVDEHQRQRRRMEQAVLETFTQEMEEVTERNLENYQQAMGTLLDDVADPVVAAELEAMQQAMQETFSEAAYSAGALVTSARTTLAEQVQHIAEDFAGIEIGADTPAATLHKKIERYPKSGDIKG